MSWSDRFNNFRRWFMPRFVSYFVEAFLLRLITVSSRLEIRGMEALMKLAAEGPCVIVVWHNRIPLFSLALRTRLGELPISAVISKSGDGELLASIIKRKKNVQIIRVAHDARHKALKQIIQAVRQEKRVLLLTPDGPRGPRYECKPGAVMAADVTGAPIMAVSWSSNRFWQLKSWDKMVIPKPFARIILAFSDPIDLSQIDGLENRRLHLQKAIRQFDDEICAEITPDQSKWPV